MLQRSGERYGFTVEAMHTVAVREERASSSAVREALSRHAGHPIADDVETFACLRRWKDGFRR